VGFVPAPPLADVPPPGTPVCETPAAPPFVNMPDKPPAPEGLPPESLEHAQSNRHRRLALVAFM
jgi:hypothetical protein